MSNFKELEKLVKSYDKGIEYNGTTYATIFGAVYVDTVSGTDEGHIKWTSENKSLLNWINKQVFSNVGEVISICQHEDLFALTVELKKIDFKKINFK